MAINSSMLNGEVNSLPLLHPISGYSKSQRYTKIPITYSEDETSIDKTQNAYSLSTDCAITPLFIPAIVSLQVALFVYYSVLFHTVPSLSAPVPLDSIFIFRSDMKRQIWRYISYAFVHAGWWHLIFNVSVELFIGMPLEISVGSVRTSIVFMSGILAGVISPIPVVLSNDAADSFSIFRDPELVASKQRYADVATNLPILLAICRVLAFHIAVVSSASTGGWSASHIGSLVTSILERGVSLMGASGGVYALLALHIANVLFSFDRVDCALCWIIVAVFVASCDTAFAIFDHYTATKFMVRHTAYATHLVGAAAGFSLGLVMLRPDDEKHTRRSIYWSAFAFYVLLMFSAIVYNIIVA